MSLQLNYIHIITNLDGTKDIYFFDDKLKDKQKNNWQSYFNKDFLKSKNIATFKIENQKLFAKFHTIIKIEDWQEIDKAITKEDKIINDYEIIDYKKLTNTEIELKKQEKIDIYNAYNVIMYAYGKFCEKYSEFVRITRQE